MMADMETIRLAVAMTAGAVFIIGILYLLMHWRLVAVGIPTRPTHLIFCGLCFGAVAYDLASIGLYGSGSHLESFRWQRAQTIALSVTLLMAMYFVSSLVTWRRRLFERLFSTYYLAQTILLLALPPGLLTWGPEPEPKIARLAGSLVVVYPELVNGLIPAVNFLVGILLGVYIFSLVIRFGREGNRHATGPILAGLCCCAVAALNDLAVSNGWYGFFYLIEFSLLPVAVGMTAGLINRHTRTIGSLAENQLMLDLAPSSITVHELDGTKFLYANQRTADMHGYTREEFLELGLSQVDSPASFARVSSAQREILERGEISFEAEHRRKDGSTFPVEVYARITNWGNRRVVLSIATDVTERRNAEAAFRESEEQFRQLAENINAVFWIVTPDWRRVIYISPGFERVWGRPTADLYRNPSLWREAVHEEDGPALDVETARKMTGDFSTPDFPEYRVVRPDGSTAWILAKAFPVRDEEGVIVRIAGLAEDITEAREARQHLLAAKATIERQYEELRQLDTIKDGLLRDVTHELQTPVAKQAMYLELLRRATRDDNRERLEPIMKVLEGSVRRQQEVIRNLLDLSRLEAGGRRFDIIPVKVAGVVRQVAEDYRAFLEPATVELELRLDDRLSALADADMLVHVLSNLLNNAIKFRKPGRPGTVRIDTGRDVDDVVIRVADDGIGLDAATLTQVFDRFFQATASTEGSGVGLAICKVLVEGMGGSISLDSAGPGQGCVAEVRLPISP